MKPLITNIQRFCLHDGPGIRTTVFFKGCSLHCPWCANPENIDFEQQAFVIKEKCKESCIRTFCCNFYQNNSACIDDINKCSYGVFDIIGKYYSNSELYNEVIKDKAYYNNEGGVTFSGGEALLFLKEYKEVINKLRSEDITTCVETALFVPIENVVWAAKVIDFFYVDIKVLDYDKCRNILGGDVNKFIENLEYLYKKIDKDRLIYRIPFVRDITYTKENIDMIIQMINCFPPKQVEIFSVHNLGEKKYERLGKKCNRNSIIELQELEQVAQAMKNQLRGIPLYINQI